MAQDPQERTHRHRSSPKSTPAANEPCRRRTSTSAVTIPRPRSWAGFSMESDKPPGRRKEERRDFGAITKRGKVHVKHSALIALAQRACNHCTEGRRPCLLPQSAAPQGTRCTRPRFRPRRCPRAGRREGLAPGSRARPSAKPRRTRRQARRARGVRAWLSGGAQQNRQGRQPRCALWVRHGLDAARGLPQQSRQRLEP